MMEGVQGRALCLDYDFNDVSGYVGLQRDLPIDYPENYAFAFELRGDSPANDLEMKFVDASGDNVWWVKKTCYRSEEHTSELQSLMRISYAVFCLKNKNN